jgi:pyrimidine operon attenuation protein/uracil phosphoribosyltransferase
MKQPTGKPGKQIMDRAEMDPALARIAAGIIDRLGSSDNLAIPGIRRRGAHLSRRLCVKLGALLNRPVPNGALDITLYRDDLTTVCIGRRVPTEEDEMVEVRLDEVGGEERVMLTKMPESPGGAGRV